MFSANTLFAQIQFKSGYIITLDGNTLFGEIDYQDDNILSRQCRFRENPQSQLQMFSPSDIAGYRFTDGKYFVSKNIDGKLYFLEYLLNGTVSLYTRQDENRETRYYVEKEDVGIVEIPYESKVLDIGETSYASSTTKHIGVLQYFMQDAEELSTQISAIREPTRRNLLKLTENYHNMVCDSIECVIYARKLPRIKFNPQLVAGTTYISSGSESVFLSSFGLLLHFSLTNFSDKFYIKTGLLAAPYDNKFNYWIPLQFEYLYPVGVVRPRVSLGINLPYFDAAVSAGLCFMLNDKMAITADYDFNLSNPALSIAHRTQYMFHTFYVGLRFNI